MRAFLACLLLVLTSLLPAGAAAQDGAREARFGDENIAVQLHSESFYEPGKVWMLALRFTPSSEEWHGYWRNPGDAGQGMQLTLDLPQGWEAGDPLYPVPGTLLISGLMNHIYKGEHVVLVPVTPGPDAAVANIAPITGFVEYLACTDRICVPQDAVLEAVPGGDFGRWRAAAAPLLDSPVSFEFARKRLRLAIPLPAALELGTPHVFIGESDTVDYAAVQSFSRDGDLLIAEIPLADRADPAIGSVSGIVAFGNGDGVRFTAAPGAVPANATPLAKSARELPSLWLALGGALLGGLLLNFMPCVFPILSLKALALARAGGDEGEARRDALAYTAGAVIACLALGALLLGLRSLGENVGWAFQLQEPAVVVGLLVLAMAITFALYRGFGLPGLAMAGSAGETSSFATGLLAAFVATPCTGPFMAAAMGAALLLPPLEALVLFGALGFGLALPFLLLGLVPALRSRLPKPGAWMDTFRKWMALPMALTSAALVWLIWRMGGLEFALFAVVLASAAVMLIAGLAGGLEIAGSRYVAAGIATFAIIGAGVGLYEGFKPPRAEREDSIHRPLPFSEATLAQARASGAPVFVWFTADWCVTCKVNEAAAIEREAVAEAFREAGVVTIRGDWTRREEAITSFLFRQGAAGVPLYLYYPAGGDAQKLPQVLTPSLLEDLARPQPVAAAPRSAR